MFRIKKGHHGYIKRKKRLLLGEVLGLLIGIIGLVVIGVVTTGSRKNLLTVVAMVSVIPMVNQLVILIALWKYQPCPDKEYEQVASIVGKGILDTELVITSKTDKSFLLDYACIHEKGVFCYCSDKNVSFFQSYKNLLIFLHRFRFQRQGFHLFQQFIKKPPRTNLRSCYN